MKLSIGNIADLDPRVRIPSYDRRALTPGIVHIGVGGFHRAHLAAYADDLAGLGHTDWGIVGAGVLPQDADMAEALHGQDGLYTLVTRGPDSTEARVVGSLLDYVHAHPSLDPLVERIAAPTTQIVSLTITEGGYPVDDAEGLFAPDSTAAAPGNAFEAIVRGLQLRRERGHGPLTVLSCDNIIGNGDVARIATLGVAAGSAPELVDWIAQHVAFPNSMVDRITPATSDDDRTWLTEAFGVEDRWPVMTEPFRQWVVEDSFAAGRPPLEALDVIVTDDVEPYELFKLRLLNAGHSCLAYLAALADIERVDEVLVEERFANFLRRFLDEEAGPMVPRTPGIDLDEYKRVLVARFSNPAIGDQVARLCLDGSAKFPKFLMPTVRGQLGIGGPIRLAALALAGWCQYLLGRSDDGRTIDLAHDPRLSEARSYAEASVDAPLAFLRFGDVFGTDLPSDERFVSAFTDALTSLRTVGVRRTLDAWLAVSAP